MIQVDADINAKDSRQFTPLHVAAKYGHCEVVKCLIKHNADKDGNSNGNENGNGNSNENGNRIRTPMDIAAFYGHNDVVEYFEEIGASRNYLVLVKKDESS